MPETMTQGEDYPVPPAGTEVKASPPAAQTRPPRKHRKKLKHKAGKTKRSSGVAKVLKYMGKAIHKARGAKKLSQGGLAAKAGVSISYISMLERGDREPTLETVLNLAKSLNVKPGTLYGFDAAK